MNCFRTFAALLATATLALSGCQSSAPPEAEEAKTPGEAISADSGTPTDAASTETSTAGSPAMLTTTDGPTDVRESVGGIVAWEVRKGVKQSTGTKLGQKADAFLTDHLLRPDRWTGAHRVKAGELDALAEKLDPKLYAKIETSVEWFDRAYDKYGAELTDAPAKVRNQVPEHAQMLSYFMFNTGTVEGGKGPIRNEITDKVVWIPSSGTTKGLINTWISVKTRRANNTGTGKEFSVWQAWKQLDDEWKIVSTGWSRR